MIETPPKELMANSAVVDPMLMQASKEVTQKETITARRGIFQPGVTLKRRQLTPVNHWGGNLLPERGSQRRAAPYHAQRTIFAEKP